MAMAKFTVDTTNKLFICKAGVTDFDIKRDLYSDAKQEWLLGSVEMGYDFPMRINPLIDNSAGGTEIIPLYVYLRDGWRLRPDEADHTLEATNGILLVDGGGDPFVDTVGAWTVRINYKNPVASIGNEFLNQAVEGGVTVQQTLAVMLVGAGLLGKTSGAGAAPGPFKVRDLADLIDRITVNYDANGNRTGVTYNLTGL